MPPVDASQNQPSVAAWSAARLARWVSRVPLAWTLAGAEGVAITSNRAPCVNTEPAVNDSAVPPV